MNGGAPFSVDPVSGCQGVSLVLMGSSLVCDSPSPVPCPKPPTPDILTHTHTHAYSQHGNNTQRVGHSWQGLINSSLTVPGSYLPTRQSPIQREGGRHVRWRWMNTLLCLPQAPHTPLNMFNSVTVTAHLRCRNHRTCISFNAELVQNQHSLLQPQLDGN